MSHEGCISVYARLSKFGFISCLGYNPKGIEENPEDVINICFYPEEARELNEDEGIAYVDHEKRLFKWSMTPDEAKDIADHLIKAVDYEKKALK